MAPIQKPHALDHLEHSQVAAVRKSPVQLSPTLSPRNGLHLREILIELDRKLLGASKEGQDRAYASGRSTPAQLSPRNLSRHNSNHSTPLVRSPEAASKPPLGAGGVAARLSTLGRATGAGKGGMRHHQQQQQQGTLMRLFVMTALAVGAVIFVYESLSLADAFARMRTDGLEGGQHGVAGGRASSSRMMTNLQMPARRMALQTATSLGHMLRRRMPAFPSRLLREQQELTSKARPGGEVQPDFCHMSAADISIYATASGKAYLVADVASNRSTTDVMQEELHVMLWLANLTGTTLVLPTPLSGSTRGKSGAATGAAGAAPVKGEGGAVERGRRRRSSSGFMSLEDNSKRGKGDTSAAASKTDGTKSEEAREGDAGDADFDEDVENNLPDYPGGAVSSSAVMRRRLLAEENRWHRGEARRARALMQTQRVASTVAGMQLQLDAQKVQQQQQEKGQQPAESGSAGGKNAAYGRTSAEGEKVSKTLTRDADAATGKEERMEPASTVQQEGVGAAAAPAEEGTANGVLAQAQAGAAEQSKSQSSQAVAEDAAKRGSDGTAAAAAEKEGAQGSPDSGSGGAFRADVYIQSIACRGAIEVVESLPKNAERVAFDVIEHPDVGEMVDMLAFAAAQAPPHPGAAPLVFSLTSGQLRVVRNHINSLQLSKETRSRHTRGGAHLKVDGSDEATIEELEEEYMPTAQDLFKEGRGWQELRAASQLAVADALQPLAASQPAALGALRDAALQGKGPTSMQAGRAGNVAAAAGRVDGQQVAMEEVKQAGEEPHGDMRQHLVRRTRLPHNQEVLL
eukprot:jgi/Mesen1/2646/ME000166S01765